MTYLRRKQRLLDPFSGRGCPGSLSHRRRRHFRQFGLGLLHRAGSKQRGAGGFLASAAEEPARRLRHHQATEHEEHTGRQRSPENACAMRYL